MMTGTGILWAMLLSIVTTLPDESRRLSHPFFESLPDERAWVTAHRGGSRLWPENTMHAFAGALETGVHMLEMDIRMTADGIPVVIHDGTVDRTTDGSGSVEGYSFDQLRRLDAGYSWKNPEETGQTPYRGAGLVIPSLEEVFKAFPSVHMVLEIKESSETMATALGDLIERYNRHDRTLVASFHTPLLRFFRASYPGVATSAGRSEVFRFWLAGKFFLHGLIKPDYEALQVPERWRGIPVVTPVFVRAARQKNLSLQVWTVNEPEDMERFLNMGVDALITDAPDRALVITEAAKQPR